MSLRQEVYHLGVWGKRRQMVILFWNETATLLRCPTFRARNISISILNLLPHHSFQAFSFLWRGRADVDSIEKDFVIVVGRR